ncbi:kinesin-like protein KIN-12B isoform X2 [Vigna radiata var. radiata]|uniref:Kinesin-like protein KIN-12B isoform X2 n=1 Tax=Vigna radiata var. radiata TaxID=3916 RepID=A0A1S3W2I4_VIGRR|nr:kinesin-like protein KIN-12B isoform X2 [Vigna radiata var. radiata]
MKHFMLPRNPLRDAELASAATTTASSSSAKTRPSRKHKHFKENDPPFDPNLTVPSPAKFKSPLPLRPSTSNPLKRKLAMDADALTDNSLPASSDSVKVIVRMRPLCPDKDEGDPTVQKVSNDSLSINGHNFTFDSVADTTTTQLDIFEHVGAPLVEHCLAGFNSSVFAYGQK